MATSFCIVLAEPNPLLAEKSAGVAARHGEVWCVAQVSSAEGLRRVALLLAPDLVFADIALLQPAGTVAAMKTTSPGTRIVALVDAATEPYVSAAARLGVAGVVEKPRLADELHREILRLGRGGRDEDVPARGGVETNVVTDSSSRR